MLKNLSNKELVAAGHKFAANISADTPLIDMAKMVSELATQLDVALAAAAEAGKQRDQVVAEISVVEAIHDECVLITDDDYDACPKSVQKIIRSLAVMKIPATDAYLNAVRAEGGPSLQTNDLKALMRFNDTCDDGEGYDIGDEAMNRLVELGLVAKERGKMRVITSFGMWVIAREQGEESGVLETQRDRDQAFQQKIAQLRAGNAGKDGV